MLGRIAVFLGLLLAVSAAQADDASAPPGRYTIAPSETGFVRMDTQTGRSSHCGKRDGTWICEPIAEVGARIEDKVDALGIALGRLERQIDDLAASVTELKQAKEERVANAVAEQKGFATTLVDRFVGMVRELKHGSGS